MVASSRSKILSVARHGYTGGMGSTKVNRVLVFRLGSLGDHMVALPCYRLVRRAFPGAEVRLLTNVPVSGKAAAAEAVLDGSGLVDGYLTYVVGERGALSLAKLWWMIFRWRPDVMVYLAPVRGDQAVRRDAKFFRLCGIKRIVGVPLTEDLQRTRSEGFRDGVPWYEQEGLRLARCVAELGDARTDDQESWSPGLTPAEREEGFALTGEMSGAKYFAFSLGTKAQSNQWGVERWQELLAKVAREWPGHGLAIIGAPDEREVSETVAETWRAVEGAGPALNLCGLSKPRVSAAVVERAVLFFGHDSGPGHMAASVGTPVLGIFSARMKSGEWVPHGAHVRIVLHWVDCGACGLETCIVERKKCILSIGVEEAFLAAREHLWSMQMAEERSR